MHVDADFSALTWSKEGVESVGDGDAGNFRVPNSSPHD